MTGMNNGTKWTQCLAPLEYNDVMASFWSRVLPNRMAWTLLHATVTSLGLFLQVQPFLFPGQNEPVDPGEGISHQQSFWKSFVVLAWRLWGFKNKNANRKVTKCFHIFLKSAFLWLMFLYATLLLKIINHTHSNLHYYLPLEFSQIY